MDEQEKVLDYLVSESILDVTKQENGKFEFRECCDRYFSVELSKEEVQKLIVELSELIK